MPQHPELVFFQLLRAAHRPRISLIFVDKRVVSATRCACLARRRSVTYFNHCSRPCSRSLSFPGLVARSWHVWGGGEGGKLISKALLLRHLSQNVRHQPHCLTAHYTMLELNINVASQ